MGARLGAAPPAAAGSSPGPSAGAAKASVVEYLLLLQADGSQAPEVVEAMIESIWSLQYMVPGVVCAAAGPVVATHHYSSTCKARLPALTHAVHFRLAGRPALEAFMACPQHAAALTRDVEATCSSFAQVGRARARGAKGGGGGVEARALRIREACGPGSRACADSSRLVRLSPARGGALLGALAGSSQEHASHAAPARRALLGACCDTRCTPSAAYVFVCRLYSRAR
jgi:hypothetical protein